eukprot:TRINITY_DN2246_c0_g1_i1.p2 TRINITY_DN2246_c0_g1~~TRINITY_DN2246_c0_g1_i1.p2  ORF type:complete len:204 (-),score=63.26 TRINITY_DN2246_c0_g1_i1:19-630(-)
MKLLIVSACVLCASASRGEDSIHDFEAIGEVTEQVKSAPGLRSKSSFEAITDALAAANEWLFMTGPAPMVTAMSQRSHVRTLFIFGLALFAMLTQIRSLVQTLMRGLNRLSKLDEEAIERQAAAVPMTPAAAAAANMQEEEEQRQRIADFRRERLLQRQQQVIAAPARQPAAGRRCHSMDSAEASRGAAQAAASRRSRSTGRS